MVLLTVLIARVECLNKGGVKVVLLVGLDNRGRSGLSMVLLGVGGSCFRGEVILHEYNEELLSAML